MKDLSHLLRLARDRSATARQSLVEEVADLYFSPRSELGDREVAMLVEILRALIRDTEVVVRRSLARRLAAEPGAPREVVLALANDEFPVAEPVLSQSPVLLDIDLVQIVRHHTAAHRGAIAGRKDVPEPVAEALIEVGEDDVLLILLGNRGARLSRSTMERMIDRARRSPPLQPSLLDRPEMAPDLAARIYWWVSAQLRQRIQTSFRIDKALLDQALDAAVQELTTTPLRGSVGAAELANLAEHLAASGALTPDVLVQVLRQGDIGLFELLFARMADIQAHVVHRMIAEPGGETLALACKALGIGKPAFASIFLLSRRARPGDQIVDPHELSETLKFFDRAASEFAQRVIQGLRDEPAPQGNLVEFPKRRD